jgi:hypothetical protein
VVQRDRAELETRAGHPGGCSWIRRTLLRGSCAGRDC